MTRRTVRIDRLVLRSTGLDPRHAERLRRLVEEELGRLLEDGRIGDAVQPVPTAEPPEYVAPPLARAIRARLPRDVAP